MTATLILDLCAVFAGLGTLSLFIAQMWVRTAAVTQ